MAPTLPLPPQGEGVALSEGDWVGDMVVVTATPEGDTTGVCVAAAGGGEGEGEAVSPPP